MKTALTQLIEKWETERGSYIPNAPIYAAFIAEAKELLKAEKEQMVKFAFDFYYDMSHQNKVPENYITENREHSEIYFNNTFNPKQNQ